MKKPSKDTVITQLWRGLFSIIFLAVVSFVALVIILAVAYHKDAPDPSTAPVPHELSLQEAGQINAALKSNDNPYPCINNTSATCLNGPGISYYPVGYKHLDTLNSYQSTNPDTIKEIMGVIITANDTQVSIKTDSNTQFRINFPANTLQNFLTNKGSDYNINTVIGQRLLITYHETPQASATTIRSDQVIGSILLNPIAE